jgi:hypothetical protein
VTCYFVRRVPTRITFVAGWGDEWGVAVSMIDSRTSRSERSTSNSRSSWSSSNVVLDGAVYDLSDSSMYQREDVQALAEVLGDVEEDVYLGSGGP